MRILQAGVPKSGNYWLYRVLHEIAEEAAWEHRSFIRQHPIYPEARTWPLSFEGQAGMDFLNIDPGGCSARISAVFRERLADPAAYVRQCSHVWTHSLLCARGLDVIPLFDRVVYIVRDPRDVAVSYAKFAFTPHKLRNHPPHYERDPASYLDHRLEPMLETWVRHVGGYLRHRAALGLHVVFYERLLHDFDAELDRLLAYLGADLRVAARARIADAVTFRTMRARSPDHLRQGRWGQWHEACSAAQERRAAPIVADLLALLHYPALGDPAQPPPLPRLPETLSPEALDAATRPARLTWTDRVRRVRDFALSDRPLKAKLVLPARALRRRLFWSYGV